MAAIITQTRAARLARARRDAAAGASDGAYVLTQEEYDTLISAVAQATGLPAAVHSIPMLCMLLNETARSWRSRISALQEALAAAQAGHDEIYRQLLRIQELVHAADAEMAQRSEAQAARIQELEETVHRLQQYAELNGAGTDELFAELLRLEALMEK